MPAVANDIIAKTQAHVEEIFKSADGAHDFWHIQRVYVLAKRIGAHETGVDMLTVELAALLHDIADYKMGVTDEEAALQVTQDWLIANGLDESHAQAVANVVRVIGFRGGKGKPITTKEGQIVSDADQLDSIGAIGIARTFAYGGAKGRVLYDPERPPETYDSVEAYKKNTSPSINHFHEKLLLLKDRLYTETAKQIAKHRHEYMEQFLEEFHAEWGGRR